MHTINLQEKTKALNGRIEAYWFENANFGLEKTLIHRIVIPLKPFDSGLGDGFQPEKTELSFDGFSLNIDDPSGLEGIDLNHENYDDAEAFVLILRRYHFCQINRLKLVQIGSNLFKIHGDILVEFEFEGTAKNEPFIFETQAVYVMD